MLPIFLLIVGLLFLFFGIKFYVAQAEFKKSAVASTGKVIDVTTNKSKTGGLVYSPVISFTTAANEEVKFNANAYRNENYTIGESIEIIYDPTVPHKVYLNSNQGVYGGVMLLLAAGVVCIIGSVLLYIKNKG